MVFDGIDSKKMAMEEFVELNDAPLIDLSVSRFG